MLRAASNGGGGGGAEAKTTPTTHTYTHKMTKCRNQCHGVHLVLLSCSRAVSPTTFCFLGFSVMIRRVWNQLGAKSMKWKKKRVTSSFLSDIQVRKQLATVAVHIELWTPRK